MDKLKVTPKDFFLWFGALITMYGSVIALITLFFEYINYVFPDRLETYVDPYSGSMRFAMATLIVLAPVAIIVMRFIRKDIVRVPEKNDLWVRRWALVLTVFLAAAIVVGDLITLINYFLGGDLTTRFLLKVLVVLLAAGGLFLHFLADLRGYWTKNTSRAQSVGLAAGGLIIASIVAGFFIMGSPAQIRLYRFDEQKVNDLQSMQWQIVNFWQQKEKLPISEDDLIDPLGGYTVPRDPQDDRPYVYRATSALSFELCATFNAESKLTRDYSYPDIKMPVDTGGQDSWQHGTGEKCFARTIDPERYPPFEKARIR